MDSKSGFFLDLKYRNGQITLLGKGKSGKGDVYFRNVTKPAGTAGKASEIYLTDHGTPYELTTNFAYGYKDPGIGTKLEAYLADQNGKLQLGIFVDIGNAKEQ